MSEFYQLKQKGTKLDEIKSSGDRVAYFTIQAETREELRRLYDKTINHIKIVDNNEEDIIRHDLFIS